MVNKNIYLLDGSFTSGIKPYVDIDSVMSHPLWGSHLLLNDEESILSGCKDYIKGWLFINYKQTILTIIKI